MKDQEKGNGNFKENIIEDIPETAPEEFVRPIGNLNRKVGDGQRKRIVAKRIMQAKQTQKRRAKNKAAKNARKRNRRK